MTDWIQRQVCLVSYRAISIARKWVIKVLISIRDTYYTWASPEVMKQTSGRFSKKYGSLNCFALMDGTFLELACCPTPDDFSDYHDRKFAYALTVFVVNNDGREIFYCLASLPGSSHNNRV